MVLLCPGWNPVFSKKFYYPCQNFWWPFLLIYTKNLLHGLSNVPGCQSFWGFFYSFTQKQDFSWPFEYPQLGGRGTLFTPFCTPLINFITIFVIIIFLIIVIKYSFICVYWDVLLFLARCCYVRDGAAELGWRSSPAFSLVFSMSVVWRCVTCWD